MNLKILSAVSVLGVGFLWGCGKPKGATDAGTARDSGMVGTDGGVAGVSPSVQTLEAAQSIQREIPGATVTFSQHTGAIAQVEAPGLSGLDAPDVPLVESHGVDAAGNHAALMEFLLRYHDAFGVTDPANELQVPLDAANDAISLAQEQLGNSDLPSAAGLRRRRLVQSIQGVRIPGRELVGLFDSRGGLLSVSARLLKVDATFPVVPSVTATELWSSFPSALRDAVVQKNPSLAWLKNPNLPTETLEHAVELVVEMVTPNGAVDSSDPSGQPRLAYRLEVRGSGQQALVSVDAKSFAVLTAVDTMPSDWISEGTQTLSASYDELGKTNTFFLTTDFFPNRYLGVIPNPEGTPLWVQPGQAVIVSSALGTKDASLVYKTPITIPAEVGGQPNYWPSAPTFTGTTRQAAALMSSIMTTFDYWSERRGWNGWDGQGATFYATVFTHKQASANPELNAWGANGVIQIGDGTTATSQFLGSSRMVMGHELTHNVISATTKLTYANESGAVNEALADFFGMAVTANRAADDYSSDYIGHDVGWDLRDMVDPTLTTQPANYADYRKMTSDSGGVHTNSGILNKAHTLLVKGGTFNGRKVPRVGLGRVEQVLWASMRYQSYGTEATMEEFANGVLGMCDIIRGVNELLGDHSYAATCAAFRTAYMSVNVLPTRFSFMSAVGVTVNGAVLQMLAANTSGESVGSVVSHSTFKITDLSTGMLYTVAAKAAQSDAADGGSVTDFLPGERMTLTADLPDALKTVGNGTRALDVELELDNVKETAEGARLHHAGFTLAADFLASDVAVAAAGPGSAQYELTANLENPEGSGVNAGVAATVLARNGGHAAFDLFTGLTGMSTIAAAQSGAGPFPLLHLTTSADGNYSFANGLQPIELSTATPIPGRPGKYEVWFDAQGGLDALNARFQVYVLVDSGDQVTERNESNNLLCANCRAPGQAAGKSGVVVRLPLGTAVGTLFPASVQAAVAKLPAHYPRVLSVPMLQTVHLPYKMAVVP